VLVFCYLLDTDYPGTLLEIANHLHLKVPRPAHSVEKLKSVAAQGACPRTLLVHLAEVGQICRCVKQRQVRLQNAVDP